MAWFKTPEMEMLSLEKMSIAFRGLSVGDMPPGVSPKHPVGMPVRVNFCVLTFNTLCKRKLAPVPR